MNLRLAQLAVFSCLSILNHSNAYGRGGMELHSSKMKYTEGEASREDQEMVDQFQAWALAKTINPNTPNDMVVIATADTRKTLNAGTPLTQKIMDDVTINAAKDFGYALPLRNIMRADLGISIGEFVQKSDDFILRYIAKNNPEKLKVWIEARESLKAKLARRDFIHAKVLGPGVDVNIQQDRRSPQYCRPISCEVPRRKLTVRVFADIDKLQASRVLDENDLAGLKAATTVQYYFVKNPETGKWAFQEVFPGYGLGAILTVTSFSNSN